MTQSFGPAAERYGRVIWIFPGDSGLAEQTPLPSIPELEGSGRWACIPIEFIWNAAVEGETGQVRDPVTGRFMGKDKPWDMGHKPGYEFSKHAA